MCCWCCWRACGTRWVQLWSGACLGCLVGGDGLGAMDRGLSWPRADDMLISARPTTASRQAVRLLDELPAAVVPELRLYGNRELCGLLSGYATAKHYHRVSGLGAGQGKRSLRGCLVECLSG